MCRIQVLIINVLIWIKTGSHLIPNRESVSYIFVLAGCETASPADDGSRHVVQGDAAAQSTADRTS